MTKTLTKISLALSDVTHLMLSELERSAHLSADTRLLQTGDVFLAYPVGRGQGLSDNRIHIPTALKMGVSLVLFDSENWSEDQFVGAREVLGDKRCFAVPHLGLLASELSDWWYGQPSQAMKITGVTGTNGKTTVTHWLAQTFSRKHEVAVFGTLGYGQLGQLKSTGFTTPDAARVQRVLAELQTTGFKQVAMEVSSHALEQGRTSHVQFKTAIFTNLSHDHLDYHGDMQEYARAKFELFRFQSLENIIINMDDEYGRLWLEQLSNTSQAALWAYGSRASFSMLKSHSRIHTIIVEDEEVTKAGMYLNCSINGQKYPLQTGVLGKFNISNMMAVLAAMLAGETPIETALAQCKLLKPVEGRLEMMNLNDAMHPLMIVDFAHTPDALEKVLVALKPIAQARGGDLVCVFGCGGNRDSSKRPRMGKLAASIADRIIFTSDNPRSENPDDIIAQIVEGVEVGNQSKVTVIVDRAFAILSSVKQSQPQDVVLVAGKGHEGFQEIAGKQYAFSDQDHIRLAIRGIKA